MRIVNNWTYAEATELLGRLPKNIDVLADLGAGKRDNAVSSQVSKIVCNHLITVEKFEPYLEILLHCKHTAKTHDVVHADITMKSNYKLPKCDVVLMLDVIEHLIKPDALELLDYLKTITAHIIIFTPVGDTIGYTNNDSGNPLQAHLSAWTPEEFEALGFEVTVYEKFHAHLGNIGAMWCTWKRNV